MEGAGEGFTVPIDVTLSGMSIDVTAVLRNACWEGDGRCRDLRSLLHYLRQAGYEGTETSVGDLMMMFYQDKSPEVRIGHIIYGDWSVRLAFVLVHARLSTGGHPVDLRRVPSRRDDTVRC